MLLDITLQTNDTTKALLLTKHFILATLKWLHDDCSGVSSPVGTRECTGKGGEQATPPLYTMRRASARIAWSSSTSSKELSVFLGEERRQARFGTVGQCSSYDPWCSSNDSSSFILEPHL